MTIWIGRRSHGIYLWHAPLPWLFDDGQPSFREPGIRLGSTLLVTLGASVGVAAFSYKHMKSRFLRLKLR